jgi:pyridoxal phosphate enzyme (YggS family)
MTGIAENLQSVRSEIPRHVTLVAISKTKSPAEILEAYQTGHRQFGENRVQELMAKQEVLPPDIEWHMVGHLQTNKIKYIVPFIHLIQSVDSMKLLTAIDKEGAKVRRLIPCLLQVFIASEENKFGFSMEELHQALSSPEYKLLRNISIRGVMGMATFTNDRDLTRREFRSLVACFHELQNRYFLNNTDFKEISMGMSGDYAIAIEEGATMVRIGSLIFGSRCNQYMQNLQ